MGKLSKKENNELFNTNSAKINQDINNKNKLNYSHTKKNYLENSQILNFTQKRNDATKFIPIDINTKIDYSFFPNRSLRKNSKDSENLSTSNDENQPEQPEEKIPKITKKFKKSENKKFKEEPFKSTALDFKKKYKTELCKYFEINGYCKYGDNCAYAHGKENLRLKVTNTAAYRTKKCISFFEKGYCPYGNRCQFAHQLESNIINNPFDKKMSYMKILEILSKKEKIENLENIIEKPRLKVFKDIIPNEKDTPSTLLNDIKAITC